MAQAIATTLLGDAAISQSAGLDAADGMHATREAIQVMRERGLDISDHQSRGIAELDLATFDMIVALTPAIAEELQRLPGVDEARVKVMSVKDPYGRGLEEYRRRAVEIESALRALLA
jgi:protein-tyrosine-phosphatase